jgi:hypothetical protein
MAILSAGVRSVVAMSHSLYVSGAQEFLPAFYERLFATGQFGEGVRGGRRQMLTRKGRVCARGRYDLEDWLVPVVYSQGTEADQVQFAARAQEGQTTAIPAELAAQDNPYGFIGRDAALLQLERAMHRKPAVLLVTGLGGVGKTTLARGFAEWLLHTNGLGRDRVFWFGFDEINSAEYVLNRLGERLFGPEFATAEVGQKLPTLVAAFREHRFLIVWDNFEVVHGLEGGGVSPKLPEEDRRLLAEFIRQLRGGATKIIVTSRGEDTWLLPEHRFKLSLSGLTGEVRC